MLCNGSRSVPVKEQGSFRFFVTTNPNQLKDKVEMRKNRKHVMCDYLRKERCKAPGTRDIRAEAPIQTDKRRRLDSDTNKPVKSLNLAAPSHIFGPGALTPQSSCDETARSESEGTMTIASRPASQTPRGEFQNLALVPQLMPYGEDEYPACECARSDSEDLSGTCECSWPERDLIGVPDLFSVLGFRVSPYHTWLQTTRIAVDLEKLKFVCGRRLRSCSMRKLWLPFIIRARHSFLSTLCISTAHDEAMQRVVFGSDSFRGAKKAVLYERLAVKSEVISMINTSMDDPQQRTSDATIIAVLNILNSEMISCDTSALKTHQRGLKKMISMRGGLDKLGVLGHLARTVTVTMLTNAVLQEETADDMYLLFAQMRTTTPPANDMLFPESPIYCGRKYRIVAQLLGASESLTSLEMVRRMTCVFLGHEGPNVEVLKYLHGQVWDVESECPEGVPSRQDRMNEAIRLTSRLYADALVGNVSFSHASSFPTRPSSLAEQGHAEHPAAFVEIVRHLRHTDLDRVWGGLSGVLFWISLVAGAAAKKAKLKDINEAGDLAIEREEEEARQWLAAVAVRCSIILGFEHSTATLGCLQNMLDIQARLSRSDMKQRQVVVGPARESVSSKGFGDFALEFLAEYR